MSYQIYLFAKELLNNKNIGQLLENEKEIPKLSSETVNQLKEKLIRYKYVIKEEKKNEIKFYYISEKTGISARLTNNLLAFTSGTDEDGIFEIMQTASEFVNKDIIKYDIQSGEWEQG